MGNALLVAGSYGMGGAAVLAAKACMRAGVGKATVLTPKRNVAILQTAVPEAVLAIDRDERIFSEAIETDDFDALGIGPGLGRSEQTAIALIAQLKRAQCPVVADADALNILSNHHAWMQQLPKGIIFTPHPKELDRLEGNSSDSYERLTKARSLAEHLQGYVILKGHYTAICVPDGKVWFNTTGNAGMATAGSGDVLVGIITALLARGYERENACKVGVYLHGLAGDLAAAELGQESLMASDLISYLPMAFKELQRN
jgi:NAD(P)H-hydrate epimerase